jgi:hypothetical protein
VEAGLIEFILVLKKLIHEKHESHEKKKGGSSQNLAESRPLSFS